MADAYELTSGTLYVSENFESRERETSFSPDGSKTTWGLVFDVQGAANETIAYSGVLSCSPSSFDGCPRAAVKLKSAGYELYRAEVDYEAFERDESTVETGADGWTFDVSTQNTHITHSLTNVSGYAYDGTAYNWGGAINVNDTEIAGCDIQTPVFTFTETRQFSRSDITYQFASGLMNCVGTVNSDVFKTYQAGEVLLTAVQGQPVDATRYSLSYTFAVQPNQTNLTIGAAPLAITVAEKQGWDYLWVYSKKAFDESRKRVFYRPTYAYVERVYRRSAFNSSLYPS